MSATRRPPCSRCMPRQRPSTMVGERRRGTPVAHAAGTFAIYAENGGHEALAGEDAAPVTVAPAAANGWAATRSRSRCAWRVRARKRSSGGEASRAGLQACTRRASCKATQPLAGEPRLVEHEGEPVSAVPQPRATPDRLARGAVLQPAQPAPEPAQPAALAGARRV